MSTILDILNFFLISVLGSMVGTMIVMLMFLDRIVEAIAAKVSSGVGHGIAKGIDDYRKQSEKKGNSYNILIKVGSDLMMEMLEQMNKTLLEVNKKIDRLDEMLDTHTG